ncbi:MAG: 3-hydroxybutyrate dehydrogenase [Proteobacteria bacterium]|nr:3-hydroxybutyrate dehydrogenase [Pseudomonadota bacterium]
MSIKSKSAVITGSTSGIGLGIATALAKAGVNVIINGFGESAAIEHERQNLEKTYQVKAFYHNADMTKPEQIQQMIALAQEKFDGVDILVNNAGIQHVQVIDEFPDKKWDDIIAINLSSSFHTIKASVPSMKKKGWGRIINIASVHGLVASPFKAGYVAAKHGLVGLTKVAALDLATHGITANAICPGYVDTPLVRKQLPDQAKEYGISEDEVIQKVILKDHFIKQFVKIDDIADLTLFLCSDAARMMTGETLCIDGGWTAH